MPEFQLLIHNGRESFVTTVNASNAQAAIADAAPRIDANATKARIEILGKRAS